MTQPPISRLVRHDRPSSRARARSSVRRWTWNLPKILRLCPFTVSTADEPARRRRSRAPWRHPCCAQRKPGRGGARKREAVLRVLSSGYNSEAKTTLSTAENTYLRTALRYLSAATSAWCYARGYDQYGEKFIRAGMRIADVLPRHILRIYIPPGLGGLGAGVEGPGGLQAWHRHI